MIIGVLLGIAAGALWGLIYIGPLLLPDYNPILFALGRFIAFGAISLPCLYFLRRDVARFSRADWWEAFKLPLFGNVLFYALLTLCIRLSGAPLAGMFMAVIPVLVAICANLRYAREGKALAWGAILPPLVVIFAGLVIANWTEFAYMTQGNETGLEFWAGVGFGLAAVAAWTWFSIKNADWLLAHPQHSTQAWTAIQGVSVLPVVLPVFAILAWPAGLMDTSESWLGTEPWRFVGVSLMIGFLCSWVAMLAWNAMSQRLPAALGGQLIVFESIFSVVYALIYRGQWPTPTMAIGFVILLAGVMGSLHVFGREPPRRDAAPVRTRARAARRRKPSRHIAKGFGNPAS